MPLEQHGLFVLRQAGTLVSGTYELDGGWTGSLQGTLVNRKVFLVRIDSKLGRMMELEGFLSGEETLDPGHLAELRAGRRRRGERALVGRTNAGLTGAHCADRGDVATCPTNSTWPCATCVFHRGRTFLSVITLISVAGVTVGTAALVIALSLMAGFVQDVRDRIHSGSAHLTVMSGEGMVFRGRGRAGPPRRGGRRRPARGTGALHARPC